MTEPGQHRPDRRHQNIIKRYFEILNLYPKIDDPALARRIDEFTMSATPDELFRMQNTVFDAGRAYMSGDSDWETIIRHLDGKEVGLQISDEYSSTVAVQNGEFKMEKGIRDPGIPVFKVASRRDYVDALLRRKDLIRMIIRGRLGATHKITLARWGLSFFHLLSNDDLLHGLLDKWGDAERILSETLSSMGF